MCFFQIQDVIDSLMGLSRYRQPQAVPSEIYEFTGGKHFKFMEITELSTAKLTDTLRS